jgi:hypothetical protein
MYKWAADPWDTVKHGLPPRVSAIEWAAAQWASDPWVLYIVQWAAGYSRGDC